jgi:hypothetical protein
LTLLYVLLNEPVEFRFLEPPMLSFVAQPGDNGSNQALFYKPAQAGCGYLQVGGGVFRVQ